MGDELKQLAKGLIVCMSFWLAVSAMHAAAFAQDTVEDERLFKAAFIYNFAKFTQWPENTWQNKQASLTLCTAGKDVLVTDLKRLGGKMIQGRAVSIQPLGEVASPATCHVLYIAISEKARYGDILKSIRNRPVLTVSELPNFVSSGGMIGLYHDEGQTRFSIDLGVARDAGLVLSSRLLSMAVVTDHGAEP